MITLLNECLLTQQYKFYIGYWVSDKMNLYQSLKTTIIYKKFIRYSNAV